MTKKINYKKNFLLEMCRILPGVKITNDGRLNFPPNFIFDEDGNIFILLHAKIARHNLGLDNDESMKILEPVVNRSDRKIHGIKGEMSQSFLSLRTNIKDVIYNIVLNGGIKESGTSARFKEITSYLFSRYPDMINIDLISSNGNKEWSKNCLSTIKQLKNLAENNKIEGISNKDNQYFIDETISILNTKSVLTLRKVEKTLLCARSIGSTLSIFFDLNEYIFDRGEFLQLVRSIAVIIDENTSRADNCYPVDIIIVRKNKIEYCKNLLNEIVKEIDPLIRDTKINQLFYNIDDISTYNNPMVGISLKEDSARLGRCKSAIDKIANLSEEEKNISYDEAQIQITKWKQYLKDSPFVNFNFVGAINELDTRNYKQKYMVMKLIIHIVEKISETSGQCYMEYLLKTCLGIKHFPYMIVKGNRSGFHRDVVVKGMSPKKQLEVSFNISPYIEESKGYTMSLYMNVINDGKGETCKFLVGINSDQSSLELLSME